jgi:hypothetical protein
VDRRMLEMLLVFTGLMTTLGCVTVVLLTIVRRFGNRPVAAPELNRRLDEIADRLSRLEPAIDAMSVEVERISEAQRFTAKILTQRATPLDAPPKIAGTTTPH